jgi:hypothetical protein
LAIFFLILKDECHNMSTLIKRELLETLRGGNNIEMNNLTRKGIIRIDCANLDINSADLYRNNLNRLG